MYCLWDSSPRIFPRALVREKHLGVVIVKGRENAPNGRTEHYGAHDQGAFVGLSRIAFRILRAVTHRPLLECLEMLIEYALICKLYLRRRRIVKYTKPPNY